MVNTPSTIVHYLLERGFLTFDSVVDGDVIVAEATSRHRNCVVIRQHNPSYFVKQIQDWQPEAASTLRREALVYQMAQRELTLAPLVPLMPKYHAFDAKRGILILELLPEAENLSVYHRRLGQFPTEVAAKLGKALGTYHSIDRTSLQDSPHYSVFPQQVPWIFSFHQGVSPFSSLSGANSQLLAILRQYPELPQALDILRSQWQTDTLIHGDMKWDNCIVYPQEDGNGELNLKVVDWEIADLGDACWDVGAIFGTYISFWVMSMPINAAAQPAQMVEEAPYQLVDMQPAMQTFWKTYVETRFLKDEDAALLLERCVKYSAARMLQTVYEQMLFSPQITPNAVSLLQVSLNILQNPQEAIAILLLIGA
ncbi:phosphotransferase family protein [Cylindrospermum stagnale PCC 7417]|uniref:Phosphotransferase family protein n=1 Tax=Cylindrospermum stagnale PCC 7417 TaxID=56107 RepID=K9X4F3_9NOST|nr:phosphotransferase [Cylindrospermum stagnale]AFZ27535.1 phosphotransferase family protein [Cylindrospermum stagnale PCC 7417]